MSNTQLFDTGHFSASLATQNNLRTLSVSGSLDERVYLFELDNILEKTLKSDSLQINLSKVSDINSAGMKNWVQFIKSIEQRHSLVFEEIQNILVVHAGIILGFLGSRKNVIESFMAPYFCPICKFNFEVKLFPRDMLWVDRIPKPPEQKCSKCGKQADFDDIEDEYFVFLVHYSEQVNYKK